MKSIAYKDVYQVELSSDKGTRQPNGGSGIPKLVLSECFTSDCDCVVYCEGKDFLRIFGNRRANTKYKRTPPIVKVTNPKTGNSIHRVYRMGKNCPDNTCALSYFSLLELINNNDDMKRLGRVLLSKGSLWKYYWYHPFHATKVTTRLGILSMVIGLLSLLISILK